MPVIFRFEDHSDDSRLLISSKALVCAALVPEGESRNFRIRQQGGMDHIGVPSIFSASGFV
jgi:hypothetical protein